MGIFRGTTHWVIMALAVVVVEAYLALWVGLPGQLSTDSIIQLYEGVSHQTISFNPALMAIILGTLDKLGSGPIGFVLLSQGFFSAALWLSFSDLKTKGWWWKYLVALVLACNPVILAYTGIVWKDVLLAHAAVLLFFLISRWYERKATVGVLQVLGVVLLMTIVVGVRQQGLLFVIVAAWWLARVMSGTHLRALALMVPLVLVPMGLNKVLGETIQKPLDASFGGSSVGFKILMQYDMVGIAANGGQLPVREASSLEGKALNDLAAQIPLYSAYRVDTLTNPTNNFWALPLAETTVLWREAVSQSPSAYLKHRLHAAQAFLGFEEVRQCLPVFSGIGGPVQHSSVKAELTSLLGLQPGPYPMSDFVNKAAWEIAETPLLMLWAYVLVTILVAVWLWIRGRYVLLSLVACGWVYLASYMVLGIACDFRYGYILPVIASLTAIAAVFGPFRPRTPVV